MARNGNRGTSVEELNEGGELTQTQEQAGTARAPRPQIDTSGITIGEAVEDDGSFGKRASKLDSDPLGVAVRDAEQGKWVPVQVGADSTAESVKGIKSFITRAASRNGLGVNFEAKKLAEGVLYFKTGPKRQTKRSKGAEATPAEAVSE